MLIHSLLLTTSVLACATYVTAISLPRASGNSGCMSTCLSNDNVGFPLGNNDVNSDPIFCSYPTFPGEDPNDFFCKYDKTTGALAQDNDAGLCPGSAPLSCTQRKRFMGEEYTVVAKPRSGGVPVSPAKSRKSLEEKRAAKLAIADRLRSAEAEV